MSIRPALQRVGPVVLLIDENTGDLIGVQRHDLSIRLFSLGATLQPFELGPFPFVDAALLKGGADAPFDPLTAYDAATVGNYLAENIGQVKTFVDTAGQVIFVFSNGGQTVTFTLPQSIGTTNDVQFRDQILRHLTGSGAAPVPTFNTGVGSNSTPTAFSVTGDNMVFQLDLTPSTAPAGGFATVATFAYQVTHANTPKISVVGNNRTTRAIMANASTGCNVDGADNTGFTFGSGNTALVAGTAYSWLFTIHGK